MRTLLSKAILSMLVYINCVGVAVSQPGISDRLIMSKRQQPYATKFKDAAGKIIDIKDFKGSLTIIKFWAPWCNSCAKELPQLNKVAKGLTAKGIKIVALGQSLKGFQDIENFFQKANISDLPLYFDERSVSAQVFGVKHLPTTVFLDKNGVEIARITGKVDWENIDLSLWLADVMKEMN